MESQAVTKCCILADPRDEEKRGHIRAALDELTQLLAAKGIAIQAFVNQPIDTIEPDPDVELFVVLGGDGTMIHFAANLHKYRKPFYGLNYGNRGFMMNNPASGLDKHAAKIARHKFHVRSFPVLQVKAWDLDGQEHRGIGLNDIYLQRMTPQSCKVNITINGSALKVNPMLCDGVIVATPLGSTAYNFNVTGSMVGIDLQAITLTPVAANRACQISSLILPYKTVVGFEVLEPQKRRVQVVSDGQSHGGLTRAEIRVSEREVKLCFDPRDADSLPIRFINKACG